MEKHRKTKKLIYAMLTTMALISSFLFGSTVSAAESNAVASAEIKHVHTASDGACYKDAQVVCGTINSSRQLVGSAWAACNECSAYWTYELFDYTGIGSGKTAANAHKASTGHSWSERGSYTWNTIYTCSGCQSTSFTATGTHYKAGRVQNCTLNSLGTISMNKDTIGSYELSITGSLTNAKLTGYTWSVTGLNGTGGTQNIGSDAKTTVIGNGTYICKVSWADTKNTGNTGAITLSYTVTDYDMDPPIIKDVIVSTSSWTNEDLTLTVIAEDNIGVSGYYLGTSSLESRNSLTLPKYILLDNTASFSNTISADGIVVSSKNISHIHSGTPTAAGGCYAATQSQATCTITVTGPYRGPDGWHHCPTCLDQGTTNTYGWYIDHSGCGQNDRGSSHGYQVCTRCGTIAYAWGSGTSRPNAGTSHTYTTTSYVPKCGINTGTTTTLSMIKTNNADGYFLDVTLAANQLGISITKYQWNNSNTTSRLAVTGDGTYSCTVTYSDNGISHNAVLSYTVSDYDKEPPVVENVTLSETGWTNQDILLMVIATDNMGVDKYSIVGTDWSTENVLTVKTNGTYYIYARDLAGNISEPYVITISNIDKTPPIITVTEANSPWAVVSPTDQKVWTDKVTVTIVASDNVQLHDSAYQFDDGVFSAVPVKEYVDNGTYHVSVRDHLGNTATESFTIDNIDTYKPTITGITRTYYEDGVEITIPDGESEPEMRYINLVVSADDLESGLNASAYRYRMPFGEWSDWQESNTFANLYLNGTYEVQVRDVFGNFASSTIEINNLTQEMDVIFEDMAINGDVLGSITIPYPVGSSVSGSELGIESYTGAYYPGYNYVSCDTITVTAGTNTVHRYFEKQEYNVTYHDTDGNVIFTEKVPYNSACAYTTIPTKESVIDTYFVYGYTFIGWTLADGTPANTSQVTSDLKLYPLFDESKELRTYKVTFMVDDTIIKTEDVNAGGNATLPANPEKKGFIFTHWEGSYTNVLSDSIVTAVFMTDYLSNAGASSSTQDQTGPGIDIPDPSIIDITRIGGDFDYIEQYYQRKDMDTAAGEPENIVGQIITIYDDIMPLHDLMTTVENFYKDEKTRPVALTMTTVAGTALGYGFVSLLCYLLSGIGLTQMLVFTFALIKKKTRYVRGAWLTDQEGIKYVDKYGRMLECEYNPNSGKSIFKRRGKSVYGVEVKSLLELMAAGKLTYDEFELQLKKSNVYTAFNKDLEIEVWNAKNHSDKSIRKAHGYNLAKNIKEAFDIAGNYIVNLKNSGKATLVEMKYILAEYES